MIIMSVIVYLLCYHNTHTVVSSWCNWTHRIYWNRHIHRDLL